MQCAIPAFDRLFPEPYNSQILKLLFLCTHWHGLAKLRSHTDPTLDIFDNVTIKTGTAFRHFVNNICIDFDTRELAREEGQRRRREAKQKGRNPQDIAPDAHPTPVLPDASMPPTSLCSAPVALSHIVLSSSRGTAAFPATTPPLSRELLASADGISQVISQALLASGPREEAPHITPPSAAGAQQSLAYPKFSNTAGMSNQKKKFTLNTYKFHACGDYPNNIRRYGMTDSYSTEILSYILPCMLFY
jgi:hypothetical protein